ncbi:hypothetical protein GCM10009646_63510 [Streptomyces aureus]
MLLSQGHVKEADVPVTSLPLPGRPAVAADAHLTVVHPQLDLVTRDEPAVVADAVRSPGVKCEAPISIGYTSEGAERSTGAT